MRAFGNADEFVFLKKLIFLLKIIFFMFWIILMCWSKKWFLKNKKKNYFDAFQQEKYFKKQSQLYFQTNLKKMK